MANKQIDGLTATDRLRTGTQFELQDPVNGSGNITIDNLLAGIQWETPSQVAGVTAANIMEVEAKYLAARMRLCPDEVNVPAAGWQIGRYMWSSGNYCVAAANPFTPVYCARTTTAIANAPIMLFCWPHAGGLCVPKKVTATLVTGALTGARAGTCDLRMLRAYGLSTAIGNTAGSIGSPASQGGTVGGLTDGTSATQPNAGSTGLKANQAPSQAHAQSFSSVTVAAAQAFIDTNPIGILQASANAVAGTTQIQSGVLYDWQVAEQPLILTPGTGFQINLNFPAAATSQTIWHFVNIIWDEWMPIAPGDK